MKIAPQQLVKSLLAMMVIAVGSANSTQLSAQTPLVPGTGKLIVDVGDQFEEEDWDFNFQGAKSTENIDENRHTPAGISKNNRWYEGIKRGYPDVVKTVPTPEGGLEGSKRALLLQSLQTGIPGRPSYKLQQDDFVCNIDTIIGMTNVSRGPSCVVRVFLPPVDEWENRTGPHFALRLSLTTTVTKPSKGFLRVSNKQETETYWPGMFIEFVSKDGVRVMEDTAHIRLRADRRGLDFTSIPITVTGWWTLGMSCTPDGLVHYYAKPGVEDLTAADHIGTQMPYSFRAEQFKTFFFNVCNGDDGKTWSSPWIIDDAKFYLAN
jgi:hypothetical protein